MQCMSFRTFKAHVHNALVVETALVNMQRRSCISLCGLIQRPALFRAHTKLTQTSKPSQVLYRIYSTYRQFDLPTQSAISDITDQLDKIQSQLTLSNSPVSYDSCGETQTTVMTRSQHTYQISVCTFHIGGSEVIPIEVESKQYLSPVW